jgi:hypothetical protein
MKWDIRERIASGDVSITINPEKQNRHIKGSDGYIDGRSYLLDGVDAQELVDRYHGTGYVLLNDANKMRISKENIITDYNIGVRINPKTGEETLTNRFTIHYSKTGVHIVPTKRRSQK